MKRAIFATALAFLSMPAMAETVLDEERAKQALGMGGGGRFLISNVTNACPHIAKVMSKVDADERILFMTDAEVSFVRHASCDGDCDLLTVNNVMAPCQADTGAICAPFAGLTGGVLYDMSVDATGAALSDCGL
ncbi:hypothetical protein SAMN06295905_0236 [Devosia lucknowensis]|uniref:Uncharacterized protein n=1 Tax=Devosia lucknowensis TaxID=1096929 RepID=A0A1Y6EAB0_9HYPH|nr:hypothetical protein [Devosia lucknowensis]SMQ59476.1 hypothetical protein SAMN06295905_0236 [Devosia lucknowensis]